MSAVWSHDASTTLISPCIVPNPCQHSTGYHHVQWWHFQEYSRVLSVATLFNTHFLLTTLQGSHSWLTGASSYLDMTRMFLVVESSQAPVWLWPSGIAGGVVSQPYFETSFGLVNADGSINKSKDTEVSSNVVSVLQAGAFFGALGSAPISG